MQIPAIHQADRDITFGAKPRGVHHVLLAGLSSLRGSPIEITADANEGIPPT